MAKTVALSRKVLYDEFDLSSDHNKVSLVLSQAAPDKTVYGSTSMARAPGLKSFEVNHQGYFQAGAGEIETVLNTNFGTAGTILTLLPTGTEGEPAYSFQGVTLDYQWGGQIGDMNAISGNTKGEGTLVVRGTLMVAGSKTTSGNGTARQLGAVSATQSLYGIIHCPVHAAAGSTITVKIQSDTAEGFPSPTDVLSFTQLTDVGVQWATPIAGAITDEWWRVVWAVTGSPAATIYVNAAIL